MAGKIKSMSQIKQLLQLHQQGKSKKEIARILGISRNTVKSYLRKIEESSLHIQAINSNLQLQVEALKINSKLDTVLRPVLLMINKTII